MSDIEKKPSLRISPNVYGRTELKNRVRYLIDPKGEGTQTGVPETVVLTRWRKRQFSNYSFSGEKLSSTLWRAAKRTMTVVRKFEILWVRTMAIFLGSTLIQTPSLKYVLTSSY